MDTRWEPAGLVMPRSTGTRCGRAWAQVRGMGTHKGAPTREHTISYSAQPTEAWLVGPSISAADSPLRVRTLP